MRLGSTSTEGGTAMATTAKLVRAYVCRWFVGSPADQHVGLKSNPQAIRGLEPSPGLSG